MKRLLFAAIVFVACSDSSSTVDAPPPDTGSGSGAGSGSGSGSAASTVNVVQNCTGVAQGDIGAMIATSGFTFSPSTASINAGQYVKVTISEGHNFQNQDGAATTFSSGALVSSGTQTVCVQFNAAGSYPFECRAHVNMGMTGTITVN